jgi:hypothetical protein
MWQVNLPLAMSCQGLLQTAETNLVLFAPAHPLNKK